MDSIKQLISSSDTTTLLLVSIVAYLIYDHFKVYSFWSSRGIKGPTPWPFLGTDIYYLIGKKLEVDRKWSEKYGKIFGVYEGRCPTLRTTDNELVKHVWIKEFNSFGGRNDRNTHGKDQRSWMVWSMGSQWSGQRALLSPMFTSAKMKTMFNLMVDCMERFQKQVERKLELPEAEKFKDQAVRREFILEKSKKSTFSRDDLMAITLDVISSAFFGLKLDTYMDKGSDFYKRAYAFSEFDIGWFMIWVFIPRPIARYFELDVIRPHKYEYFDRLSQKTLDERRKNPLLANKGDFIQALMEAELSEGSVYSAEDDNEAHYNDKIGHEELNRLNTSLAKKSSMKQFSDFEIRSHMIFMFLAGFETTSNSLTFCIYELAHQQEAQEEVYRELKSIPELKGQDSYSKLQEAKKLDAFISESLRMYSVIIDNNRKVTAEDGVVLPTNPPLRLPKDTSIAVSSYSIQRDPEYWPNPDKFDMTRFYAENRGNIKSCSYMPFGLGPRNCAGMRFALLTIKLFLANLLLKYQVLAGPKNQQYPPDYKTHFFFVQLAHDDFRLVPRDI